MEEQSHPDAFDRARIFLQDYAWFIVRNIIGWVLILCSPILGAMVPGPGGLPVFLIGFALVTFPGKRRLTARVLRGRRLRIEDNWYLYIAVFVSIAIPGAVGWFLWTRYEVVIKQFIAEVAPKRSFYVLLIILAVSLTWLMTRLSLKMLNGLLKLLPRFRRKFRPWMKRQGLHLLPPRRKTAVEPAPPDEILEIAEHHQHRFREIWRIAKPWIRRIAAVAITVWIVVIMIRPLRANWTAVKEQFAALSIWRFALASVMFAAFLFFFRAMGWRKVLKGFGYRLDDAPAARIWSTSELARYLPGAIWQVIGRVYLCKPYRIPKEIVVTSQILEVCIFLMANVLVAAACLLWFGQKMLASSDGRPWMITALALVPFLALLLHPKIFYTTTNWILRRMGRAPITKRLRGRKLIGLLFYMIAGLLWQSIAVYVIVDPVLHFKLAKWWVVAGAYCLAWIAGFLAFWAPGGIGVRELVFVATMEAILPQQIRQNFANPAALSGLLVLLGFVLRLWTVVGELIVALLAYVWDWQGAMKRFDGSDDDHPPGGNGEAFTAAPARPSSTVPAAPAASERS